MIVGIGLDVVHVSRLERWHRIPGLLERYFHPEELAAARSRGSGEILSLAARFAAKEAFGKALGTGLSGITLKNILVLNNHNGKPCMHLFGNALDAFRRVGGEIIHLSLTHERDNALAQVVIEGVPK
ncbi:MAG TPA: holo-ACP synthase [Treponemataceae bacterium]|jgi:holo-[acyl-carrier protein] synthase|nr:MAG: Holo-(acyl-carrier-protein) synthase [Spirochaetes bacterium ADurb.Bin269]TAH49853.1 MAG: holo-ACP synthase [Treponema sp.]HOC28331.1 holo-ACP synthase [Treponemataceae bacterium]HPX47518.1 holo-ACP synthase [Treponemataceae bacterium]HQL32230.1 holo-ACP synthase [Treponemataceae bacterium]